MPGVRGRGLRAVVRIPAPMKRKGLAVDFARFSTLASQIRRDVPSVAESGITSERDIETVAAAGYGLALVGSALMRDGNPRQSVETFVAAGRAAAAKASCS